MIVVILCGGKGTRDIADKYCSTSNVSIQFKEKSSISKEIPEQYLDCSKLKKTIG